MEKDESVFVRPGLFQFLSHPVPFPRFQTHPIGVVQDDEAATSRGEGVIIGTEKPVIEGPASFSHFVINQ